MAGGDLTVERLREFFHYSPESGAFVRLKAWKGCGRVGEVVGIRHARGYLVIKALGGTYLAHRLAWFYVTGRWPVFGIDHRNGHKADNRFDNLRDVPQTVNMQNRRPNAISVSGLLGVSWSKRDEVWVAQITAFGRHRFLGHFDSREAASLAYQKAKAALHVKASAA